MFATVVKKERRKWKSEGKDEGKIETAINMIKKNFDNQTINEITGLTVEKIEELRKQNTTL